MAISGKNIVLTDKDGGEIFLPATNLENIGDKADVKAVPASTDYVALMDSASDGQMKKALVSTLKKAIGLEKADNTSDADKPLSNAQQAAISKLSNPNLLDNWYFPDSINQRGKNEYTADGYTIDRWSFHSSSGGKIEVLNDGILVTSTKNFGTYLTQSLDPAIAKQLAGKTVCFSSFLGEDTGGKVCINIYFNGNWTKSASNSPNGLSSESITVPQDTTNILISFGSGGVGTSKLIAAKLELGDRQTLAHQDADGNWILNDPPPNIALELAKCQRYQLNLFHQDGYQGYIGPLQSEGGTTAFGMIPTPVPLRAKPTITVSDYTRLLHMFPGGKARTVKNISAYGYTANQVQVKVTFNGDVPAGYCGYLRANNPSEGLLIVNANL